MQDKQTTGGILVPEDAGPIYSPALSNELPFEEFMFIDQSGNSRADRERNRSLARSHVMKRVRQYRRGGKKSQRITAHDIDGFLPPVERGARSPWPAATSQMLMPRDSSAAFAMNMAYGLHSKVLPPSQSTMIETNYPVLETYSRQRTPYLHTFLNHLLNEVWPLYGPPSAKGILAFWKELFTLTQTSPALFHSSIYLGGTLLDSRRLTRYVIHSPEMADHKMEAIRQINLALTEKEIPDAVIMAILGIGMTTAMEEAELKKEASEELDSNYPFKMALMPPGWQQIYVNVLQEQFHLDGIRAIVRRKGGIGGIKSAPVLKGLLLNDLDQASMNLRRPYYPFHELPEIEVLAADPSFNVLSEPEGHIRGNGFSYLQAFTSMQEALSIVMDMVNLTSYLEAWCQQKLANPNLICLISWRNALQHRLLSLHPALKSNVAGSDVLNSLYECCRLTAMLYSAVVIFPNPPSTGCLQRLVLSIKSVVEEIQLKELYGPRAKFYIWALFLAGVAAKGTRERSWFVTRLRGLAQLERIHCWLEMKDLVVSFLWMDSLCDDGGMELWNEIVRGFEIGIVDCQYRARPS